LSSPLPLLLFLFRVTTVGVVFVIDPLSAKQIVLSLGICGFHDTLYNRCSREKRAR
jgi:hypothetical protein